MNLDLFPIMHIGHNKDDWAISGSEKDMEEIMRLAKLGIKAEVWFKEIEEQQKKIQKHIESFLACGLSLETSKFLADPGSFEFRT